jgi:predicted aspartyl protease
MGKKRIMPVLISKEIDKVLIGVTTLEAMNLKVNPKTQQLEEVTAFLY